MPDTGNILPQTVVWDQGVRFKGATSTIQVIAREHGMHPAASFPFTLFSPPDGGVLAYTENLTDGLFVSEIGRIEAYEAVWDATVTSALSPKKSRDLLDTVARQL